MILEEQEDDSKGIILRARRKSSVHFQAATNISPVKQLEEPASSLIEKQTLEVPFVEQQESASQIAPQQADDAFQPPAPPPLPSNHPKSNLKRAHAIKELLESETKI